LSPLSPEGIGLRHIAFQVENIAGGVSYLKTKNIKPELITIDEHTNKKIHPLQ